MHHTGKWQQLPLSTRIVGAVAGAAFGCILGGVLYGCVKWLGIEGVEVRLATFLVGPIVVGWLGFRKGPGRVLNESLDVISWW